MHVHMYKHKIIINVSVLRSLCLKLKIRVICDLSQTDGTLQLPSLPHRTIRVYPAVNSTTYKLLYN